MGETASETHEAISLMVLPHAAPAAPLSSTPSWLDDFVRKERNAGRPWTTRGVVDVDAQPTFVHRLKLVVPPCYSLLPSVRLAKAFLGGSEHHGSVYCAPYLDSVELRCHGAVRVQHGRRAPADIHGRASLLRLTASPRPPAATRRHHRLRLARVPPTPRLARQPHLPAPRLLRHPDRRHHHHRCRRRCLRLLGLNRGHAKRGVTLDEVSGSARDRLMALCLATTPPPEFLGGGR